MRVREGVLVFRWFRFCFGLWFYRYFFIFKNSLLTYFLIVLIFYIPNEVDFNIFFIIYG